MSEKLKPCCFCGNQMKTNLPMLVKGQSMSAHGEGFYVECPQCRARGPLERDGIHAISAWNPSANPRIAELEAENAKLRKKLDESDALFHAALTGQSNTLEEIEKLEGLLRRANNQLIKSRPINCPSCVPMKEKSDVCVCLYKRLVKEITASLGGGRGVSEAQGKATISKGEPRE